MTMKKEAISMSLEIRRMKSFCGLREPVSGLSHLVGMVLSVVGLVLLLRGAILHGGPGHVVAFAIFGTTLILLYGASTLYHSLRGSDERILLLKRIDHMMVFILIAGTYTPICLVPLYGPWGISLLAVIWTLAVLGVLLKLFWINAPRALSTVLYVMMGWLAIIALPKLLTTLPPDAFAWLLAGGVFYTIGAIIYGVKRPNFVKGVWEFHETWHFFVLAGSFCHGYLMQAYVLYLK